MVSTEECAGDAEYVDNDSQESISTKVSPILSLPGELLLIIARNLELGDAVSFFLSCRQISAARKNLRILCFKNSLEKGFFYGVQPKQMARFLNLCIDPGILTQCNFNNCYWVSPTTLKNFITKCNNLESLFVAETGININHLVYHILPACRKITSLSLTMSEGDWQRVKQHTQNVMGVDRSKIKPSTRPDDHRNSHITRSMLASYESYKVLTKVKFLTLVLKGPLEEFVNLIVMFDSVEQLTVVRARERSGTFNGRELHCEKLLLSLYQAKSIVFTGALTEDDCYPEFTFGHNLNTLWSSTLNVPAKPFQSGNYAALSCGMQEISWFSTSREQILDFYGNSDLSELKSYCEPIPIFMRQQLVAPQLKLASCFVVKEGFPSFCQNHPLLEILRLRFCEGLLLTADSWGLKTWGCLSRLRVLSLEPRLFVVTTRDRATAEISTRSFLGLILRSCPSIEELEIGSFTDDRINRVEMSGEDLSVIGQCKSLRKLTLSHLDIHGGPFLTEIMRNCSSLESLRLKTLGSHPLYHPSCWCPEDLCAALPLAKRLTTLCVYQNDLLGPSVGNLLDSVESCRSLIRLSLVSKCGEFMHNLTPDDFSQRLLRLCERLDRLVALFCAFSVSKAHCHEANRLINSVVRVKRPAFRADIRMGSVLWKYFHQGECGSTDIPLVHRIILPDMKSQVGVFPYGHQPFLL